MKHLIRLALVVVLIAVALPLAPARADDPETYAGFFIQDAASGTLADNGDDTYTLTLVGVGENTEWLLTSPYPGVSSVATGELTMIWASNPDALTGTAVLKIGDSDVAFGLTAPVYDAEADSMTYTATFVIPEGEKEPDVPGEFEAAKLYIVADTAFVDGLAVGAQNSEARPTLVCTSIYVPGMGRLDNCRWVP